MSGTELSHGLQGPVGAFEAQAEKRSRASGLVSQFRGVSDDCELDPESRNLKHLRTTPGEILETRRPLVVLLTRDNGPFQSILPTC